MAAEQRSGSVHRPDGWLTSPAVARVQGWATRLRFVLALPAAALIIVFTDHPPMWPGVAITVFGEAIQLWASAHLRKNVEVIMSGPYAWVRNPMYLGRFFVGLGLTLLTWRWFLIAPYAIIFWVYAQARVLGEEARLLAKFGDEYLAYCRSARRWVPLPPGERFSDARWSWDCLLRNHELRVAVGVLAGLALLKLRLHVWGPLHLGL
jgi:protein-S-isoprenylcysteine O-methyltransferase Ste14